MNMIALVSQGALQALQLGQEEQGQGQAGHAGHDAEQPGDDGDQLSPGERDHFVGLGPGDDVYLRHDRPPFDGRGLW